MILDSAGGNYLSDAPASSLSTPGSAGLYVDVNRTDTYTADGTIAKPFKTIAAAIAQIIANGDNSANKQYVVIINPGVYPENILLENAALSHVTFTALTSPSFLSNNTVVLLTGTGAGNIIQSTLNNANLNAAFEGMQIVPTVASTITCSGASSISFIDCQFNGNTSASATNCANFNFVACQGFLQNVTLAGSTTCFFSVDCQCDAGSPSTWTLTGTAFLQVDSGSLISNNITVNTGCTLRVFNALTSGSSTLDIKSGGTFQARMSDIGGTLTAEAGSSVTLRLSRVGTFSGTLTGSGTGVSANMLLTAAAPTVAAAQIGLGNGKAATATAGAGALPAAPDSFWIVNDAGTVKKIALYLA